MTDDEKVTHYMVNYLPDEVEVKDGATTYHNARKTHRSFAAQLVNSDPETRVNRAYLTRCLSWLRLLKNKGIALQNQNID
jgi:hypothetical protein